MTSPFPRIFVINTVGIMLEEGGQRDEDTSNMLLHVPELQDEAGRVAEPQTLLELEST